MSWVRQNADRLVLVLVGAAVLVASIVFRDRQGYATAAAGRTR